MFVFYVTVLVAALLSGHTTDACYESCSATFNHRIQVLQGVTDSNVLVQRSCQAMAEHMVCLEERRDYCDVRSVQHINSIINFMRPDYERTCATVVSTSTAGGKTPSGLLESVCQGKLQICIFAFNASFNRVISEASPDWDIACDLLDNYTLCMEDIMPECGKHMAVYIYSIRYMQQMYSANCSASATPLARTECVNDTMDCFDLFNSTFIPAAGQYILDDMCSAMDQYTVCLHGVHERQECERFTQHALSSMFAFKSRYAIYCGTDGGQHAQACVTEFQRCYSFFNDSYFPSLHNGDMTGICSSVVRYSRCVQPLYEDCGLQMARALSSVRVLKEQFALQCEPEYQRLSRCQPLGYCLTQFSEGLAQQVEAEAAGTSSSSSLALCTRLEAYFPCVEDGLAQCNIPPEDTSVDFSRLGALLGAYCKYLLGNSVLDSCEVFKTCVGGIVLVSVPDPSAMFDADTWCSYMDMSLSCVQRAVNTPSCGLEQDDTIKGHLAQQRQLKRDICKLASVAPIPTEPTNVVDPHSHGHDNHGHTAGQGDSNAMSTRAGVPSLAALTVLSLVLLLL